MNAHKTTTEEAYPTMSTEEQRMVEEAIVNIIHANVHEDEPAAVKRAKYAEALTDAGLSNEDAAAILGTVGY